MNAFLKLALGLCVLTLVTAMPNDMAKAKQGGPMRLQDLKPADMEKVVNFLRRDMASRSALEIAQFLDDPAGVSTLNSISGDCVQNGHKLDCCASVSANIFLSSFTLNACLSGEYLPAELGVRFRLTVEGKTIIDELLSARNPPLNCESAPGTFGLIAICLQATNLDISSSGTFSGCFVLSARIAYTSALKVNLGCLTID